MRLLRESPREQTPGGVPGQQLLEVSRDVESGDWVLVGLEDLPEHQPVLGRQRIQPQVSSAGRRLDSCGTFLGGAVNHVPDLDRPTLMACDVPVRVLPV